jgi:hypothetical protein
MIIILLKQDTILDNVENEAIARTTVELVRNYFHSNGRA